MRTLLISRRFYFHQRNYGQTLIKNFLESGQLADTLFSRQYFLHELQSIATSTVQPFVAEYLRKECGDLNEVASDNDVKDDGDDDDDDDANSKDVEIVETGTGEILTMLDRLVKLKYL